MTQKQAHRRYMKLFIPAMILYLIRMLGITFAKESAVLPEPFLYVLAFIPAISILLWIWGHMRYITELDEYLRALQVRVIMYGVAVVMAFTTVWGAFEELADAPADLLIGKRSGVKGACL